MRLSKVRDPLRYERRRVLRPGSRAKQRRNAGNAHPRLDRGCEAARGIAKPTYQKRKGTHRSQRDAGSGWLSARLGSWRRRMDARWQQRQVTSADRAARLARSGALREKRRCRDPRLGPGAVALYYSWPTRNNWASRWRGGNFPAAPLRLPRLVAVENDLSGQAADVPEKAARGIAVDV